MNKTNKQPLIFLASVWAYLNPITSNTYACYKDGTPDMENPIKLNQVCDKWIRALSRMDYIKVIGI